MRSGFVSNSPLQKPELIDKAVTLDKYLKTLSSSQLQRVMHISADLAQKTYKTIAEWNIKPNEQICSIDSFIGDIYSGLQADRFSTEDRLFANHHLRILSGLYGILKPLDGIRPYRLEMGYKLNNKLFTNLYNFWGDSIAKTLPNNKVIVNVSSDEYMRVILPYVNHDKVITPKFLTVNPITKEPTFVAVHAKIARGAFARWLIINRLTEKDRLIEFNDLGYNLSNKLSAPNQPVFICQNFGGLGLSLRLK